VGEQLGCHSFNALYGNRVPGVPPQTQDTLAVENLAFAAAAAARIGGTVLLEPVSGASSYPLLTAADAIAVMDRVERDAGATNVRLLCDIYHLAVNGDDPRKVITEHIGRTGHVQIADAPGRHQPGTGELDIDDYLRQLEQVGYDGWVGLEYKPSGASADSFDWLPPEQRSVSA